MKLKNQFIIYKILIFTLCVLTIISKGNSQVIFTDIPDKIDPKAKFLFYLHGRIVEIKGIRPTSEKYGAYEYEKIIETLKNRGFMVISEARGRNTHAGEYAQKLVSQVNRLLDAGVPPSNITVVGASKGAFIAMIVSTRLQNKKVNFVFLAGCADGLQKFDLDFYGNILSIYDEKDQLVGSCKNFFKNSTGISSYKEIMLKVGTGHGIVYKPLKEWIDPVVQWASGEKIANEK
jgi:hypothetical protein